MNKLRLIKMYELRGKIHPIETFFIEFLNTLDKEEVLINNYIYYKKDNVYYISFNNNTKKMYLYGAFENHFLNTFDFSRERFDIYHYLLEKHLNLKINNVR